MWHITLIQYLAQQVCKSEKKQAAKFVHLLFSLIKIHVYEGKELNPPEVIGFINSLYDFSYKNWDKDVSLSRFARECIGLAILHIKAGCDCAVWCRDFIPILKDERIFNALSIEKEISKLHLDKKFSYLNVKNRRAFFKLGYTVEHDCIPDSVFSTMLIRLESQAFSRLHCTVSANIGDFMAILGFLISEIENPLQITSSMLSFLMRHGKGPMRFEQSNGISEYEELIISVQNRSVEMSLFLVDDICTLLEKYVRNVETKPYGFFSDTTGVCYAKEVAQVVVEIKSQQFINIHSIIERLQQINITSKEDKLVSIIQQLEECYTDQYTPLIYM